MNTLKITSRVLLFVCAVLLVAVLFVPMWRIELNAPQYPEGLMLMIYANRLGGNVDIINGLNHYIGMKTLHEKDFIEFAVLPGIIIFFSIAFAVTAVAGKRKWMNLLLVLFVSFGVIAMIDFWKWEYQYGHDLNPEAAIKIPGMAYQPPLIGFKQLLNFGAYSVPDIGGWIFVGVGAILLLLVVLETRRSNKFLKASTTIKILLPFFLTIFLSSCNAGPEALKPGRDNCYFCKMTISDNRFGAEVLTKKGKVFKFDDVHCLLSFLKTKTVEQKDIADVYFVDFSGNHSLINADRAFLLTSEMFQSPMNGQLAAFSAEDSMKKTAAQYKAASITWNALNK